MKTSPNTPPQLASAPTARERVLLFALALGVRNAVLFASAFATGWAPLDLAMLGDGHADMVLSKTFPALYVGTQQLAPFVTIWRDDPWAFLTRFPLHPSAIAIAGALVGDLRVAAIAVSQLAAACAVVRFRALAGHFTPRAGLAAALFAVFPATWLEASSLAYTEGLLMLCAVCAFAAYADGRIWRAAAWAGAATLAQKHGLVVVGALGLAQLALRRIRPAELAPIAAACVPFAALHLYWWALTGSPFTAYERTAAVWAGPTFSVPLSAFLAGLLSSGQVFTDHFWLRKALLLASLAFYGGVLFAAVRRWDPREAPLVAWLGLAFALTTSMGGVWAYYNFPRIQLVAAPAAVLLLADRAPWPARPALRALAVAALGAAAAAAAVLGTQAMWDLCMRVWSPGYYEQLRPLLR